MGGAAEEAEGGLVEVSDAGAGFDPDGVGADGKATGLADVRKRLRLVGGRMAIESAPGEGTRVTVRVPREAEAGPDDEAPPPRSGRLAPEAGDE